MMAGKAGLFKDHRAVELIMSSPDPSTHKRIGRGVRNFDSAGWTERRKMPCYLATAPNSRDDGLWWLGKISSSMTEDGVYLVRRLDDPGPIKLHLSPVRYTTSRGAVRGSWCLQVS